jgi:hypothetical protein
MLLLFKFVYRFISIFILLQVNTNVRHKSEKDLLQATSLEREVNHGMP